MSKYQIRSEGFHLTCEHYFSNTFTDEGRADNTPNIFETCYSNI